MYRHINVFVRYFTIKLDSPPHASLSIKQTLIVRKYRKTSVQKKTERKTKKSGNDNRRLTDVVKKNI